MRAVFLLLLSSCLCAASAQAQGNPRDFERPGPAAERAMYYAQVRNEIYQTILRWERAWESNDADALAALYGSDASYYPQGAATVQARTAIRSFFTSFLRTAGDVNVQMIDFGTSGDLAYLTARVSYQVALPPGTARQVTATDLLVLRRHSNRGWQIETHLSRVEPEEKALP